MADRRQIQAHIARAPGITETQVQDWSKSKLFKRISYSTAKRIMAASRDAYLGNDERIKFPEFEAAMLSFFALNDGKAILTDELLSEEARTLRSAQDIPENDLKLSNGWLHKFKVSSMELKELINEYAPADVFNFDESALFYRLPPNKTLATVRRSGTEKMGLVVIGKSKVPRAFRKANVKKMHFAYYYNNTAWQNGLTFVD
ncbi:hypothetical protein ATCC90586_007237 [Pythium insidiosum]|nr:hypothetical protein ATCC90586_007237 [Pythium insidiosum]